MLARAVDPDAVVPVDDVLVVVDEPHVLTQVRRPLLGDLQILVLAGEQIGAGHAVDEAGDRVGLLDVVAALVPAEPDDGPIVAEVDRPGAELGPPVEVRDGLELPDPPVLFLEPVAARRGLRQQDVLGVEARTVRLWIEDP